MPTIEMQSRFIGIGGIDDIFDLEILEEPLGRRAVYIHFYIGIGTCFGGKHAAQGDEECVVTG